MAGGGAPLFQVALVGFLGAVEGAGCEVPGGDGATEFSAGVESGFRFFCRGCLLGRMKEDRAAVLLAEIRALTVYLRRVVHFPEGVQKLLVAQLCWLVSHLHDFPVAGFVGSHIFFGW